MGAKRWEMLDVVKNNTRVKGIPISTLAPKQPSKYKNERVQIDGIWFASKKEGAYYERLKLEKRAGKVSWFTMQCPFYLAGGIKYIADFLVCREDPLVTGSTIQVIDTKGFETDVFKMKRKLMRELGIEILLQ